MGVILANPIGVEDIKGDSDSVYVDILPSDWYEVEIVKTTQHTGASGYSTLMVTFEIINPNAFNMKRKNWFFGIYDGSEKGIAFNRALLGRIARACDIEYLEDTSDLEGKCVKLKILEGTYNNKPQNSIREIAASSLTNKDVVPPQTSYDKEYKPAELGEDDDLPF